MASSAAAEQAFNANLAKMQQQLLAYIDRLIKPLVDDGKAAMAEYLAAEATLHDEKFSRN